MGSTITEKILARASGKREVSPNDFIWANVDVLFTHETIGPRVFSESFEELGDKIWDPERFAVFIDHYNLPSTREQAEIVKYTVDWSRKHGVKHLYLFCGPEHQILAENGFCVPGNVVIGTDSHTTTSGAFGAFSTGIGSTDCAFALATGKIWLQVPESYLFHWDEDLPKGVMAKDMILHMIGKVGHGGATYKACEFVGPTVGKLSIDDRMVLCNMAVEMGAKNGIINPDEKTMSYVRERARFPPSPLKSDPNAEYTKKHHFDADDLEPLIACPPNVDNVKTVTEVEGTEVNSVLIGTCTGGRYEDMEAAARVLKGEKVHPDVYVLIMPASLEVYRKMLREGLIDAFLEAGCQVTYPTCGPCAGHLGGLMPAGETRISAQNRNFPGRSGGGEIYLASPLTCAASAIKGEITDPRRYL